MTVLLITWISRSWVPCLTAHSQFGMSLMTIKPGAISAIVIITFLLLSLSCKDTIDELPPVLVSINSNHTDMRPINEVSVDIEIDPQGRGISGGEIYLKFTPEAFVLSEIVSGELLGEGPLVGAHVVDTTSGTILYAIARRGLTPVPTQTSIFARLTFTVLDGTKSGIYVFSLLTVGLSDNWFQDIDLIKLTSGNIEL